MKAISSRKGEIEIKYVVAIIIAIILMAIILYFISDDVRGMANDLFGLGPSDSMIGKSKCDTACNNVKTMSKDTVCNGPDWTTMYCNQPYNDELTCGKAQNPPNNLISPCDYKVNNLACTC